MNRQSFIDIIKNKGKSDSKQTAALNQLIQQYPYFQTAHVLYAKALHDIDSIHYEQQLRTAAAYSGSRKVMYGLITTNPPEFGIPVTDEKPSIAFIDTEKREQVQKTTETVEKRNEIESLSPLEKEILAKAASSSIEKEMLENIVDESAVEVALKINQHRALSQNKETIQDLTPSEFDEKNLHSFTEWLKGSINAETELEEERSKIHNLIDQFIDNEYIIRPKQDFFSPVNMAKMSIIDDEELVTETLANIYFDQGNLSKALSAYQKLQLKYPEKNRFFAARINEVKKLQNKK